jgi:hypothetical protein
MESYSKGTVLRVLAYCDVAGEHTPTFENSLRGKIDYEIEIAGGDFTWTKRVEWELDMARKYEDEILIFTDAWDTLFLGGTDELEEKISDGYIRHCASKVCWPHPWKEKLYHPNESPWRFCNGQGPSGLGASIAMAIEHGLKHYPIQDKPKKGREIHNQDNDQRFWTDVYLDGFGQIDYNCDIYQNLSRLEDGELAVISGGRIKNMVTGGRPHFLCAAAGTWQYIPEELYEC